MLVMYEVCRSRVLLLVCGVFGFLSLLCCGGGCCCCCCPKLYSGNFPRYSPLAFDTPDCEGVEAKDMTAIVTPGKGTLKFIVQPSFLALVRCVLAA